jgi:hypothetical protein
MICRTISWVRGALASNTSKLLASWARSSRGIGHDVTGTDEHRTRCVRTVSPVLSVEFLFLALEITGQLTRKQRLHVTPIHGLLAASGRVMDLIFHR